MARVQEREGGEQFVAGSASSNLKDRIQAVYRSRVDVQITVLPKESEMNHPGSFFRLLAMSGLLLISTNCGRLRSDGAIKPCSLVTQEDAERVFRQPAKRTNDSTNVESDVRAFKCSYMTEARDKLGTEVGDLWFTLLQKEGNSTVDWAKSVIDFKRKEVGNDNVESIAGVGDDAFLYTRNRSEISPIADSIWVRKQNIVLTFQVDASSEARPTETISVNELKQLAKRVANQL